MEMLSNLSMQDYLLIATGLVTVASIIVKLTPSETDDKIVNGILKVLKTISLNKEAKK